MWILARQTRNTSSEIYNVPQNSNNITDLGCCTVKALPLLPYWLSLRVKTIQMLCEFWAEMSHFLFKGFHVKWNFLWSLLECVTDQAVPIASLTLSIIHWSLSTNRAYPCHWARVGLSGLFSLLFTESSSVSCCQHLLDYSSSHAAELNVLNILRLNLNPQPQ